jgi:serine/threonine-protein kinase
MARKPLRRPIVWLDHRRWEDYVEGTPFGRYQLVDLLGRGGMGEVWRAYDPTFDRVVALKVLPPNFANDPIFQERFRREARAAAGLDEPHVIPIHDFGEVDGRLFVTMRLIEGRDLQKLLENGPLEPTRAVNIIEQIAFALDAAHRVGLVHRDIKPSNILIADNDFAYLIDFGIARAAGETGLTSSGATIGTWSYMAPERFRSGVADASADTYALTCVLHQSLTGQPPFRAQMLEQIAAAHMFEPPPKPSLLRPGIPAAMDEVIACGMAKAPYDRYTTAKDFAAAARAALSARPTGSRRYEDAQGGATYRASGSTGPGTEVSRTLAASSAHGPTVAAAKSAPISPSRSNRRIPIAVGVVAVIAITVLTVVALINGRKPASSPTDSASTPELPTPAKSIPRSQATSSATARPADYTSLLIQATDINAPISFTGSPPTKNPNGQPGVATTFHTDDNSHVIKDTILVFADPAAATKALNAAKGGQDNAVTNPKTDSFNVGTGGTTLSGNSPDNSKGALVVLFTEGKAFVTLEFDGPVDSLPPQDFITDVAQKQDAAVKKGLGG